MSFALLLPLLVALACPRPTPAQEAPPPQDAARAAEPLARELWARLIAASGPAERAPIQAFQLQATVLTRNGVQSNEAHIDYSYLAPDCIRFALPSRNETGRFGPAQEQYWLQSSDETIVLAGREYKEDRRQIDDMLALAKNYVALSNPGRLELVALELLAQAPADLGPALAKRARKLKWLALESPDFALVRSDAPRPAGTLYRVELGLREDGLPAFAIVRERSAKLSDPLLVEFSDYQEHDGFRIPFQLRVHALDRRTAEVAFAELPSQEVYVKQAALRPPLKVADFQPRKKK